MEEQHLRPGFLVRPSESNHDHGTTVLHNSGRSINKIGHIHDADDEEKGEGEGGGGSNRTIRVVEMDTEDKLMGVTGLAAMEAKMEMEMPWFVRNLIDHK